jgi:hypothetical protein
MQPPIGPARTLTCFDATWISQTPPGADTLRAQAYDLDDFLDGIVAEDGTVQIDGKRARGATLDGQHFVEALCGVIGMVEMGAGAEALRR